MSTLQSFVPPDTILLPPYGQHPEVSLMLMSSYPTQCHYIPRVDKRMRNKFFQRFPGNLELKSFKKVTLVQAFSEMLTMCSSQLQVFEKISPRCLCEGVSHIITPSIDEGGGGVED